MDDIFQYEHPFVCTDAAIFTIKTQKPDSYRKLPGTSVMVLLYKRAMEPYKDKWCLPGGFLDIDELPEDNIRRKILEKSQISHCWMEQLYTFCDIGRDPRARVLSVSYLGLMNERDSARLEGKATWFSIQAHGDNPPVLINSGSALSGWDFGFDHFNILQVAIERLRNKVLYTPIVFHLLPDEFTLTQLQNVYEAILGKKDQAANFRRKIMNRVRETGGYTSDQGHRPAKLYTKKKEEGRYHEKTADRG